MSKNPAPPIPSDPVISLQDVEKRYHRGGEEIQALNHVTFDIPKGQFVVILGPSGGGKSTLLHLIGGMDRPSHGSVVVLGRNLETLTSDGLAAYRRRDVGFVFQSFHLLPGLTAEENVALPLLLAGIPLKERQSRANALLARVGLADRAHHKPGQLSGGQAQRVAVARALAADPPIILADEPTGNLDSKSGQEIIELLRSLAHQDGRTVIVVTHNEEFAPLADRVLRVRDGQLIQDDVKRMPDSSERPEPAPTRHMSVFALVHMAWSAITRRIGRGILTGLGITIGVAAMVLFIGLGSGLEAGVVKNVTALGPLTTVNVSPSGGHSSPFQPAVSQGPVKPITPATVQAIRKIPGVRGVYLNLTYFTNAHFNNRNTTIDFLLLPPPSLWNVPSILPTLAAGRVGSGVHDILLSKTIAQALVGPGHAPRTILGRQLTVTVQAMTAGLFSGGQSISPPTKPIPPLTLTITGLVSTAGVGYLAYPLGAQLTPDFVPPGQGQTYPGLTVITNNLNQVTPVANAIQKMGYSTTTLQQALGTIEKSFSVIETALGAIGGIALVVAGLMIGVVMSMAVLERRREIGVLKAVGARRRDISRLFLSEAGIIGFTGGMVGVLLGAGVGHIIDFALRNTTTQLGPIFVLPMWLIGLGLVFGTGVSVIAGAIPASHAAGLNPVDALRDE